ncbi:MAG: hypothetical protein V2G42_06400 [bacterium JZ-2024 1]
MRDRGDHALIQKSVTTVSETLKARDGAFGTSKRQQVMLETKDFNSYQVQGWTFAPVLGSWYFNRDTPRVVIREPVRKERPRRPRQSQDVRMVRAPEAGFQSQPRMPAVK